VLLDPLGARSDLVEVPYGQCDELARVTGGYVYVPVLVDDDGKVVVESRDICE
jgi:glutathione S-transferase